jgi:hypothetical protein
MTRIVVHNHLPTTRSLGRFRATAGVLDHKDCGCGCGGKGDCNHSHDDKPGPADYGQPKAVGPDVKFMGGPTGRWNAFINGKMLRRIDGAGRTWKTREGALAAAKAEMPVAQRDKSGYAKAELGIDVTWSKGGYGRPKISEPRHYSVPDVTVDPRGHPPSSAFVGDHLRRQPGYHSMIKSGWTADKVEGYYKREQRDVGRMV